MIDEKTASFVNASGNVNGPFPWNGFNTSSGHGQAICKLDYNNPGQIQCLEPNGEKQLISLSLSEKPSGKILKFTKQNLLTISDNYISYYSINNNNSYLRIENAGLTTNNEPFVSLYLDENWSEVCIGNGNSRLVPINYDMSHFSKPRINYPGNLYVLAVDGERSLTFNYNYAEWSKGSVVEKSFVIDDHNYGQNVFPHAWLLQPRNLENLNTQDGSVILSVTGPTGIAIIGLQWNPN